MPLIAVTTSIAAARGGQPERIVLNTAYLAAVESAGGTPLPLAPGIGPAALADIMARADGLLLTGGGDVDPARYGQQPHPKTAFVSVARDEMEAAAIRLAIDAGKPLLAICRGMQMVNVALGGTLHQHVPDAFGGTLQHAQDADRPTPTHGVRVEPGSRTAAALGLAHGETGIAVNSMHHQAVDRPGDGLVPTAWAPDGVVEALDLPGYRPWFAAVQWHPEEMAPSIAHARHLFAAFVDAADGGE
jgi:putative glutamine amidotransferase